MKGFGSQIFRAVAAGKLAEPFDAVMVKQACPGWSDRTYHVFLPKHAEGNPDRNAELFVRVARGLYRLKKRQGFSKG